jgi:hypothetical protein
MICHHILPSWTPIDLCGNQPRVSTEADWPKVTRTDSSAQPSICIIAINELRPKQLCAHKTKATAESLQPAFCNGKHIKERTASAWLVPGNVS